MKTYGVQRGEVPLLATSEWKAPLQLNKKQQAVRLQSGTVLLLGRSGTGKTLCLIDRMVQDRRQGGSLGLTQSADGTEQLFVCRSRSVCEFVRRYQEHHCAPYELQYVKYSTFDHFLSAIEQLSSAKTAAVSAPLEEHKRIDFIRFREEIFPRISDRRTAIDPLVVWTQIRSFFKGSIQAVFESGTLSLHSYLDASVFPPQRCDLHNDHRHETHKLIGAYGYWDDMDRAMRVLLPLLSGTSEAKAINKTALNYAGKFTLIRYRTADAIAVGDRLQQQRNVSCGRSRTIDYGGH